MKFDIKQRKFVDSEGNPDEKAISIGGGSLKSDVYREIFVLDTGTILISYHENGRIQTDMLEADGKELYAELNKLLETYREKPQAPPIEVHSEAYVGDDMEFERWLRRLKYGAIGFLIFLPIFFLITALFSVL